MEGPSRPGDVTDADISEFFVHEFAREKTAHYRAVFISRLRRYGVPVNGLHARRCLDKITAAKEQSSVPMSPESATHLKKTLQAEVHALLGDDNRLRPDFWLYQIATDFEGDPLDPHTDADIIAVAAQTAQAEVDMMHDRQQFFFQTVGLYLGEGGIEALDVSDRALYHAMLGEFTLCDIDPETATPNVMVRDGILMRMGELRVAAPAFWRLVVETVFADDLA